MYYRNQEFSKMAVTLIRLSPGSIIGSLFVCCIICSVVGQVSGDVTDAGYGKKKVWDSPYVLFENLMKNYHKEEWPTFNNGTHTRLFCEIHISAIRSISMEHAEYEIDFYLSSRWTDPRLVFLKNNTGSTLTLARPEQLDRLWLPNLAIYNLRTGGLRDDPFYSQVVELTPDGNVSYTFRITGTLSCEMMLRTYPFDRQQCTVYISANHYSTEILWIHWQRDGNNLASYGSGVSISGMTIGLSSMTECVDRFQSGTYSCLNLHIAFDRDVAKFVKHTYFPTFLIVGLSWVGFFIRPEAITTRLVLCLGALILLAIVRTDATAGLPALSYLTALDIWMGACLIFIYLTLVVFAVVAVLVRKNSPKSTTQRQHSPLSRGDSRNADHELIGNSGLADQEIGLVPSDSLATSKSRRIMAVAVPWPDKLPEQIDLIACIVLPVTFGFFIIIYWIHYCSATG